MLIRFAGFAHTSSYLGPSGLWEPGDVREVGDAEAAALISDFGGAFVEVKPEPAPKRGPVRAPDRSVAMKAPERTTALKGAPTARSRKSRGKPASKPKKD